MHSSLPSRMRQSCSGLVQYSGPGQGRSACGDHALRKAFSLATPSGVGLSSLTAVAPSAAPLDCFKNDLRLIRRVMGYVVLRQSRIGPESVRFSSETAGE